MATAARPQKEYGYAYTFVADFAPLSAAGPRCKASRCRFKNNQKVSIRNSVKMTPACSRRSNSAKSICSPASTVTWHQTKYIKIPKTQWLNAGFVHLVLFGHACTTQAAQAGAQCGLGCRRQALTCPAASHPQQGQQHNGDSCTGGG